MKNFDKTFLNDKVKLIAGVDEAGRGPLAGPVVAAAVIFDIETEIDGINDSKKLSEKSRESLFDLITENALSYSIGIVSHGEIDQINILQASLLAMKNAVGSLNIQPDLILIDGNKSFASAIKTKTIVKGDAKSFSIAAASILAKVTRDRIMRKEAIRYPSYSWVTNKGYGTKEHIEAIKKFGPTPMHRKTFLRNIYSKSEILFLFGEK